MWEVCQAKLHSRSQSQALFYFVVFTLHVFVSVWRTCGVHFSLEINTLGLWDQKLCECVCVCELAGHFLSSREGGLEECQEFRAMTLSDLLLDLFNPLHTHTQDTQGDSQVWDVVFELEDACFSFLER